MDFYLWGTALFLVGSLVGWILKGRIEDSRLREIDNYVGELEVQLTEAKDELEALEQGPEDELRGM